MLYKELLLEWKQKYALNGLILYVLSMVVVVSLAFANSLNPLTWNIVFWILILFVAINAVAKSFLAEDRAQQVYLYSLAHPTAIMLAKIIYNVLLLWLVASLTFWAYAFLSGVPIEHRLWMQGIVLLGGAALAANLTLVSAIASKAANRSTLLAVLSFPLLVPMLLLLIRLSRYAVEGLDTALAYRNIYMLLGITVSMAALSVILFPFVWRD
ncbi:MAG: heme exporter protein CcmB [Bacteroidota bacterium]